MIEEKKCNELYDVNKIINVYSLFIEQSLPDTSQDVPFFQLPDTSQDIPYFQLPDTSQDVWAP